MTRDTAAKLDYRSTLIVEDNAFLSTELYEALDAGGLNPMPPVGGYPDALASLSERTPALCVLDLDLGRQMAANVPFGEEGRRLLAILRARGCRTVVYSAHVSESLGLREIAPDAEILSKSRPVEDVVAVLRRLAGMEPLPA